MTMRRKGRHSLVVEGTTYHWALSERDDSLSCAIVLANEPRQKLCVRVSPEYRVSTRISHNTWSLELRRVIIAPAFVQRAIIYGLGHGWIPNAQARMSSSNIGMDSSTPGRGSGGRSSLVARQTRVRTQESYRRGAFAS